MSNLFVAGKITVFKTLAISKMIHLALVNVIPISTILKLNEIRKHGKPKIKHCTLCTDYEIVDLKNVGITFKIIILHFSWVKQLYDIRKHDWKLISLHIMTQKLGKQFLFNSNKCKKIR